MTPKQKTTALCCICFLLGTFMGYWINDDVRVTESISRTDGRWIAIPKDGYFYTTGLTQRAWYDGIEYDLYDFQDQLELDLVDGVLGTSTRLRVMNRNATDIRIMESTK